MNIQRISRAIAAIMLAAGLAACGGGSDEAVPAPRLQSLHVAGGSYVTQSYFVLDVTSAELKYVATRGATVDTEFRGPISAADFQRLATLVESANLTQALGERSGVTAPCRTSDTQIAITTDKARHDFIVPGGETCGAGVTAAYAQLSALYVDLIEKYVPARTGG